MIQIQRPTGLFLETHDFRVKQWKTLKKNSIFDHTNCFCPTTRQNVSNTILSN